MQTYPTPSPRPLSTRLQNLRRKIDAIVQYQNTPNSVKKETLQAMKPTRELCLHDFSHLYGDEEPHRIK
jgi:hypothetical protein